jgi:hypothetical protein
MERRWSRRKPVSHEVLVRFAELGMLRCQLRNLSFEGAFLETGRISLPPTVDIELFFNPPAEDDAAEAVCIGANVVRSHIEGAGVSFVKYHNGSYQYLLKLLN